MKTVKWLCMAVLTFLGLFHAAIAAEVQHPTSLADARLATVLIENQGKDGRFSGLGSGWFVDVQPFGLSGCYVLTNNHVIDGEQVGVNRIYVSTHFKREAGGVQEITQVGEVVYFDPQEDIALVKISTCHGVPRFKLSTRAFVGESVYAIGAPRGLDRSVSSGVVSNVERFSAGAEHGGSSMFVIQTDAPINPGNSGGPLVDAQTFEVVGMNVMVVSSSDGLGFSVHGQIIERALMDYVSFGRPSYPVLGVVSTPLTMDLAMAYNVPAFMRDEYQCFGRRVQEVVPDSAAFEAGFKEGDVVLTFNGLCFTSMSDMQLFKSIVSAGESVRFQVWRESTGEILVLDVIPDESYKPVANPRLDGKEEARVYDGYLGFEVVQGDPAYATDKVVITSVYEYSEAFWANVLQTMDKVEMPGVLGMKTYELLRVPALKVGEPVRDGLRMVTTYQTIESVRDTSGAVLANVTPETLRDFAKSAYLRGFKVVLTSKVHVLKRLVGRSSADWVEDDVIDVVSIFAPLPYQAP